MTGIVLDPEFGMEIGKRDDPACNTLGEAIILGLRVGLSIPQAVDYTSESAMVEVPVDERIRAELAHILAQEGNERDQLDSARAIALHTSRGLVEIDRNYRTATGAFDMSRLLLIIESETAHCPFCGTALIDRKAPACPRCGILID